MHHVFAFECENKEMSERCFLLEEPLSLREVVPKRTPPADFFASSDNGSDELIYGIPRLTIEWRRREIYDGHLRKAPADSASLVSQFSAERLARPSYENPELAIDRRVDHWSDFSFAGFVLV
jgi:hypothetical protein